MNAVVTVESYFGLTLEIDLEKETVKIKKDGILNKVFNFTTSEIMNILKQLHADKGEDKRAVCGWLIADLLNGEKLAMN